MDLLFQIQTLNTPVVDAAAVDVLAAVVDAAAVVVDAVAVAVDADAAGINTTTEKGRVKPPLLFLRR